VKVSLVTLGCDKNTVDSERYLAQLAAYGAEATADPSSADLVIVNTCGFIDAAKKESIDALVEAGRLKETGNCQAVIAVGCMVQRHRSELEEALPEVDFFLGASDSDRLVPELVKRGLIGDPVTLHPGERLFLGDVPHVRYLKISEGCDHGCAFCAIPLMRGRHRSFAADDVVREAQLLEMQGALEVNLVAQDLAHYGRDRRDGVRLPQLLQRLVAETDIPWFRMLYLYSAGITPALLETVSHEPRILPYLDMPIQHASDSVLERMRRPERQRTIREKVNRFRDAVPDLTIRTTCIVGFPGETDDDFQQLLEFLDEMKFDRVGAFTYSPQEGTRAFDIADDVPEPLKRERLERLEELQREISAERLARHVGRETKVLTGVQGAGAPDVARAPWQADDVDGIVRLDVDAPGGSFIRARIESVVDEVDHAATALGNADPRPAAPARTTRRALPVAATSIGTFGR
jgi:ribosomal protein S12 methylthiotransferase